MSASASLWWYSVAPLYIAFRVALVNRLAMTDCDEVYNYWEPLAFLLQSSDGGAKVTALQTWEYAHDYQLRTYAYLVPLFYLSRYLLLPLMRMCPWSYYGLVFQSLTGHTWLASFDATSSQGLILVCILRAWIAACTAWTEVYFLSAALPLALSPGPTERADAPRNNFDTWLALLAAAVMATGTGLTHASGALLPSSTWMAAWCLAAACWLRGHDRATSAVAIAATLGTGWPFGAVAMVPLALSMVWQCVVAGRIVSLGAMLVATTLVVQGIVAWVDVSYYGVWTLPTYNIFAYNAGGNGDTLYGVEPVSYYVKNLLLNMNLVAPLGMAALVVFPLRAAFAVPSWDGRRMGLLGTIPFWLAVTVPRPHKEERFLFPLYPVLVWGALYTVDSILLALTSLLRSKENQRRFRLCGHVLVWIPVIGLSLSRTAALQRYYSAPLDIYTALHAQSQAEPQLVCVCGEWYRYPGTLYLPTAWQLGFLPSSFEGQLPQVFSSFGSHAASQAVLQPFNDANLAQPERYVTRPEDCAYVVDLVDAEPTVAAHQCLEHVTSSGSVTAQVIASVPFLDGERTSTLHRTLYVPYWHEAARRAGHVSYQTYVLYQIDPASNQE